VATSSLTSFSGSTSRRIQQSLSTSNSTIKSCLQTQSFASSYSEELTKNEEKRFGLILVNNCDGGINLKIGVDDSVMRDGYFVQPGLSTLQFSLNTGEGCSPNCGIGGPDINWKDDSSSDSNNNGEDYNSSVSSFSNRGPLGTLFLLFFSLARSF